MSEKVKIPISDKEFIESLVISGERLVHADLSVSEKVVEHFAKQGFKLRFRAKDKAATGSGSQVEGFPEFKNMVLVKIKSDGGK